MYTAGARQRLKLRRRQCFVPCVHTGTVEKRSRGVKCASMRTSQEWHRHLETLTQLLFAPRGLLGEPRAETNCEL